MSAGSNADRRDPLTEKVIGIAIDVHRALGPGLLESAYEACMCHDLADQKVDFKRQVAIPVTYRSVELDCGFRIDLMIEERLIVELKAVERLLPLHQAQLLTYMRLSGHLTGLLINFNVPVLKDGLKRLVI